jgi:hypothetical protein
VHPLGMGAVLRADAVRARDTAVRAAYDLTVDERTVELADRAAAACRPESRSLFAAHAA